jgi:hypothetical protein
VPRDGDGVEADFLRLVDVLENGMRQVLIDRITFTVTVKLDAIGRHEVEYKGQF